MPTGIGRDLDRLKQGTSASAAEVRDFIGQMRGKNPQEVLGVVAQSNLLHGVTVATIATVLLMGAFTVGPYFMRDKTPKKAAPAETEATAVAATPAANTPPADATATAKTTDPTAPTANKAELLEKLEMDETKTSDPTKNPLEEQGDDLLNDLK